MTKQLLQRALTFIENTPMDVVLNNDGWNLSTALRAAIDAPEV